MKLVEGAASVDDVDAFVERLAAIGDEHDVTVQAFDARYVVDSAHLERAVELADRAIEREENVARDRAMEILLYAAGRRQINRALEMGVSEGESSVVILVDEADGDRESGDQSATEAEERAASAVRESLDMESAETLGEYDPERVREFFDVGDAELETIALGLRDIVRERVALLNVKK